MAATLHRCAEGQAKCLALLLGVAEIDVNKAEIFHGGMTPLFLAAQNGHAECVTLLLARPDIDVN